MNREVVKELVEKLSRVENEMKLLREDKKIIVDDFKDRLDMKAFMAAWQILKKREKVDEAVLDNLLHILQEV
jgi:uncharacterized protein (UPF0335 family)|tara:strand:- start:40 stop:255 length:216 start_codon:yes stop_codon:yes gene_type:complete